MYTDEQLSQIQQNIMAPMQAESELELEINEIARAAASKCYHGNFAKLEFQGVPYEVYVRKNPVIGAVPALAVTLQRKDRRYHGYIDSLDQDLTYMEIITSTIGGLLQKAAGILKPQELN